MAAPIRIANISGFFGDRPSAAREMIDGGRVDVLTGDWLAELTMLILARMRARRSDGGYGRTFVDQMSEVLGDVMERGITVVWTPGRARLPSQRSPIGSAWRHASQPSPETI